MKGDLVDIAYTIACWTGVLAILLILGVGMLIGWACL